MELLLTRARVPVGRRHDVWRLWQRKARQGRVQQEQLLRHGRSGEGFGGSGFDLDGGVGIELQVQAPVCRFNVLVSLGAGCVSLRTLGLREQSSMWSAIATSFVAISLRRRRHMSATRTLMRSATSICSPSGRIATTTFSGAWYTMRALDFLP